MYIKILLYVQITVIYFLRLKTKLPLNQRVNQLDSKLLYLPLKTDWSFTNPIDASSLNVFCNLQRFIEKYA